MDTKISKLISEIAEQVAENNLAEITYEEGDVKVKVVGKQSPQQITREVVVPTVETTSNEADKNYVRSPMVGVAYLKPAPDKEPYIRIGDKVNPDTTLCVIEAMKTFNPIVAGQYGVVKSILIDNESPIEYNQPLFEIIK